MKFNLRKFSNKNKILDLMEEVENFVRKNMKSAYYVYMGSPEEEGQKLRKYWQKLIDAWGGIDDPKHKEAIEYHFFKIFLNDLSILKSAIVLNIVPDRKLSQDEKNEEIIKSFKSYMKKESFEILNEYSLQDENTFRDLIINGLYAITGRYVFVDKISLEENIYQNLMVIYEQIKQSGHYEDSSIIVFEKEVIPALINTINKNKNIEEDFCLDIILEMKMVIEDFIDKTREKVENFIEYYEKGQDFINFLHEIQSQMHMLCYEI